MSKFKTNKLRGGVGSLLQAMSKYGSNEEAFPLKEKEDSILDLDQPQPTDAFLKNPFGDKNSEDFWIKVSNKFGDGSVYKWNEALNIVRAEEFIKKAALAKRDPLIALLEDIYDEFTKHITDHQRQVAFIQQLTKLAETILKIDFEKAQESNEEPKYSTILMEHVNQYTILHLVAHRNLVDLAEIVVKMYPGMVYVNATHSDGIRRMPLELALIESYDQSASFLASKMLHGRVRELFTSDDTFEARFRFADIIGKPNMKETVIQILESCINPQWPFVPVREGEDEEEEWSLIEDKPLQYHFHYRLLDGDQASEPPRKDNTVNEDFDHLQPSCLQLLVESSHSDVTIHHPVVRKLVDHKWKCYGKKKIMTHFFFYVLFIVFMGFALFLESTHKRLRDYSTTRDYARAACEIITIIFTVVYLIEEIDQMLKEKVRYFTDQYNWFDLTGIVLLFVLIPLRYSDQIRAEYSVAAVAFLINCFRVFKYFPAFRNLGIYSKTFAEIIRKDIVIFSELFAVVMIAFTGCVFLAIKAVADPENDIAFWQIVLREVRALTEGNPFDDSYDAYHIAVIILVLCNMGAIIVILSNILIGQLSYRYELAMEAAEIRYSVDKAKFITRLEKSRVRSFNDRIAYYIDFAYIADENEIVDLLSHWSDLRENKALSAKQAIRAMYAKMKK